MSINIGERIRHLRIYRNMSQSELVEGICSVAYLSRIENGKAKPSNQFLEKISNRLNISFEMLKKQNTDVLQENIEELLIKVEEENKVLSEEEKSFFKMVLLEFLDPQLLIRVFTVLFYELVEGRSMHDADLLYESYVNLIDVNSALKLKDQKEQTVYFRLHSTLGKYFYFKQNFNRADYHYSISETLISDKNALESAKLYYNLSLVKQRILKDNTVALYYSEKSYDIFQKQNDFENMVNVLITMAVQYHLISEYDKSLKLLNDAERHLENIHSKDRQALLTMITYNIGIVYQKLKEYEQAIYYLNKSSDSTENKIHRIYILKGLLEIKLEKKEWREVKNLLDETLTLVNEYKLTYIEVELYLIKALVYKERGEDLNYEKTIKHAIERAELESYSILIRNMATELANYYYELRLYKKASDYYLLALNNS